MEGYTNLGFFTIAFSGLSPIFTWASLTFWKRLAWVLALFYFIDNPIIR
jgi:hypothetical protein